MKNQMSGILSVVGNKIGNHPEVSLLRISLFLHKIKRNTLLITTRKRETLKQVQGGLSFITATKAFTLIELLVVVLIIGILAAVAVPQYQKAVLKSRVATVLPLLETIRTAQEVYHMANNTYANNASDLDISLPGDCSPITVGESENMFSCGVFFVDIRAGGPSVAGASASYCPGLDTWEACQEKRDFLIGHKYHYSTSTHKDKRYCTIYHSSVLGTKMCQNLAGKTTADNGNTYYF